MEITLELENFQGPLSLLYHLIEKNKVDIYDIPISEITEQYLQVIESAEKKSMDIMSEFLLMAATLLEIKSRMLLPKQISEEAEEVDPRLELIERLIEYKKFKSVTEEFREREQIASLNVFKPADPTLEIFKKEDAVAIDEYLKGITFNDIFKAFQEVMKRKEQKIDKVRSGFKSIEKDMYTVEEKTSYIKDLLILSPKISFWEIFRENARKSEIVVTFMALLELIRTKFVSISQEASFGQIIITKYNGCDNSENQ